MKVKCIYHIGLETLLTLGKDYDVIKEIGEHYKIQNDKGYDCTYSKDRFIILD